MVLCRALYQLLSGHGSFLFSLGFNQLQLQDLGEGKQLEFFLCPPVNTNSVQFNVCVLHPWRSMNMRRNYFIFLDQEIPVPQLLYTPSTLLLKHQALHQTE